MTEDWQFVRRKGVIQVTPWTPAFDMRNVEVNRESRQRRSPKAGDMIGRSLFNQGDMWLIDEVYFNANYEPVA